MLPRLPSLAGALFVLGSLTIPALAGNVAAVADYAISLGNTNIANLTIALDDDGRHYRLSADARITGLASLVASGSGKVESEGISGQNALTSERFDLLTSSGGEDFTVLVTYASRDVQSFVVNPPLLNNIDRVAIERKHLRGVNDMIAAFVLTGTPERELIDPELSPDERFLGTIEERVTMVELGLNFTATGAKTWNGLAPYAGAAVGLAFSSGDEDIGGYKFGVKVYLAPMIGTRYFLGEHLFLRAEGRATLWKLSYPSTYFAPWPPSDISGDPELAVLPGGPESEWVTSLGLVLGLGYNFRW